MKLNATEANQLFEDIFNRGTQWEMCEEGTFKELKDIDMYDDWMNYGIYQDKAAKIFNEKKTGWKVVRVFLDENGDEQVIDYFENNWDYDEFSIRIEEVKEGK
jgi:hypothetical protein